ATDSLDKLVDEYKSAREKVEEWKKGKSRQEIDEAENIYRRSEEEPHKTARLYHDAIERWENNQRQLRQLHFFWWCGLACLVAGIFCWHRVHPWLGTAFFIIAFGEMIYWTSPEFRVWSDSGEFSRLVSWKLIYSIVALTLLLAMWIKLGIPILRDPNGV